MLVGINPRLPANVVNTMMTMGHGDTIAFVDANFPARSVAQLTTLGVPMDWAVDSTTALNAVLDHFPIDTYQPEIPPVRGMQVVDAPDEIPAAIRDATPLFKTHGQDIVRVERMAFYELAKACFAIIQLAEHRPYGNFLLRKGIVSV